MVILMFPLSAGDIDSLQSKLANALSPGAGEGGRLRCEIFTTFVLNGPGPVSRKITGCFRWRNNFLRQSKRVVKNPGIFQLGSFPIFPLQGKWHRNHKVMF